MNREILFRGKRVGNGNWIEGYFVLLAINEGLKYALSTGTEEGRFILFEVIPATVGQFPGLCDKNGNKIFEGDIIHIKCGYGLSAFVGNGIVFFDEKRLQFRVKSVKPSSFDSEKGNVYDECDFTVIDSYEVIGNIYDNPELLEDMK